MMFLLKDIKGENKMRLQKSEGAASVLLIIYKIMKIF